MMQGYKKRAFLGASAALGVFGVLFVAGCSPKQNEAVQDAASNAAESTSEAIDSAVNTVGDTVDNASSSMGSDSKDQKQAVAVLHPTEGSEVRGTVKFTKEENGVRVVANFTGLKPGLHGFHVHEHGDCSAADASSAGGHFNPTDQPHGAPHDDERHVGDFGNVTADSAGVGSYDEVFKNLSLDGSNSIVGRAVIIHTGEDDLKTQPTGDAGTRDACGVVGVKS